MRYTDAPARRDELLRRLAAAGYVSSSAIAVELGVSDMTIRRDLRQLEAEGLATRVAGGASAVTGSGAALAFEERNLSVAAEKQAIAALATTVVQARTFLLDAGTTVAAMAALLPAGITVITHSVPVIAAVAGRADVELIAIGGSYQRETRCFAGPLAEATMGSLSADVAVLSVTAIDERGLFGANAMDAPIKQQMAAIAARVVVLADSSKIGARAPIRLAGLDLIDTVITDSNATTSQLDMLRGLGIEVLVAGATPVASTAGRRAHGA